MEGNLPVSAKCAVCDKTCGSVLRYTFSTSLAWLLHGRGGGTNQTPFVNLANVRPFSLPLTLKFNLWLATSLERVTKGRGCGVGGPVFVVEISSRILYWAQINRLNRSHGYLPIVRIPPLTWKFNPWITASLKRTNGRGSICCDLNGNWSMANQWGAYSLLVLDSAPNLGLARARKCSSMIDHWFIGSQLRATCFFIECPSLYLGLNSTIQDLFSIGQLIKNQSGASIYLCINSLT